MNDSINSLNGVVDFRQILRSWPIVAAGALFALVACGIYLVVAAPIYEAGVRIVIQKTGMGLNGGPPVKTYDKEFLSTQVEVIRSPATITRALELVAAPPVEVPEGTPVDPIAMITEVLRVNPLANTDVIRITFQDSNPVYAKDRLKSIVDSYQEHLKSTEKSTTSQTVQILGKREQQLSAEVATIQEKIDQLRAKSPEASDFSKNTETALLKELTTKWVAAKSLLSSQEAELQGLQASARLPVFSESSALGKEVATLKSDLSKAQSQSKEYELIYGPSHPERIAAEIRVASLTTEMEGLIDRAREELQGQRDRTQRELQSLESLLASEQKRIREIAADAAELERLRTELLRLNGLYSSASTVLESVRLADTTLADGRGSIQIEILDEFLVPEESIWPKKGPLLAVSVLLGSLLSVAGIVLTGYGKVRVTDDPSLATAFIPAEVRTTPRRADTSVTETEHTARVGSLMGNPAAEKSSSEEPQDVPSSTSKKPLPWSRPDTETFAEQKSEWGSTGDSMTSTTSPVIPR